jgi:hypothetical protein
MDTETVLGEEDAEDDDSDLEMLQIKGKPFVKMEDIKFQLPPDEDSVDMDVSDDRTEVLAATATGIEAEGDVSMGE